MTRKYVFKVDTAKKTWYVYDIVPDEACGKGHTYQEKLDRIDETFLTSIDSNMNWSGLI